MVKRVIRCGVCLLLLTVPLATVGAADADTLWRALAGGGHLALMRHALAPGTGDPPEFRLDDCATQRNLNQTGRDQARRIGEAFRGRGVRVAQVYSSQWCRCLETARLLELGPVTPLPALNSFFEERRREAGQTAALRAFAAELDAAGPSVVMVTHQVNITALTGGGVGSGEMAVFQLGAELRFIGMLASP